MESFGCQLAIKTCPPLLTMCACKDTKIWFYQCIKANLLNETFILTNTLLLLERECQCCQLHTEINTFEIIYNVSFNARMNQWSRFSMKVEPTRIHVTAPIIHFASTFSHYDSQRFRSRLSFPCVYALYDFHSLKLKFYTILL